MLHWSYGATIHLVGKSDAEAEWASRLADGKKLAINWVNRLNIGEEVKLLSQMDLVVSTDTGLMHITDALAKPFLVALFGPTLVSKNGPWNKHKAKVVKAPVQCSPCQYSMPVWHQCGREAKEQPSRGWPCMQSITPVMVMACIREWWKNHDNTLPSV
jgi:ADP-heptose:LPS heptosyltransferase